MSLNFLDSKSGCKYQMCDSKSGCKYQMHGRNSLKKPFFSFNVTGSLFGWVNMDFLPKFNFDWWYFGRMILVQSHSWALEFKMLYGFLYFFGFPDIFVVIP